MRPRSLAKLFNSVKGDCDENIILKFLEEVMFVYKIIKVVKNSKNANFNF